MSDITNLLVDNNFAFFVFYDKLKLAQPDESVCDLVLSTKTLAALTSKEKTKMRVQTFFKRIAIS